METANLSEMSVQMY